MRYACVLVLALFALTGCTSNQVGGDNNSFIFVSPGGKSEFHYQLDERRPIEDLGGPDVVSGSPLKISSYVGKVVVLNFWASWCAPCRAEQPDLEVAAQLSSARPVQFVGVNVQDDQAAAKDYIERSKTTYPSIFDPTMRTLLALPGFPSSALPSTVILDRHGRVATIYLGRINAQKLDEELVKLSAEE